MAPEVCRLIRVFAWMCMCSRARVPSIVSVALSVGSPVESFCLNFTISRLIILWLVLFMTLWCTLIPVTLTILIYDYFSLYLEVYLFLRCIWQICVRWELRLISLKYRTSYYNKLICCVLLCIFLSFVPFVVSHRRFETWKYFFTRLWTIVHFKSDITIQCR